MTGRSLPFPTILGVLACVATVVIWVGIVRLGVRAMNEHLEAASSATGYNLLGSGVWQLDPSSVEQRSAFRVSKCDRTMVLVTTAEDASASVVVRLSEFAAAASQAGVRVGFEIIIEDGKEDAALIQRIEQLAVPVTVMRVVDRDRFFASSGVFALPTTWLLDDRRRVKAIAFGSVDSAAWLQLATRPLNEHGQPIYLQ